MLNTTVRDQLLALGFKPTVKLADPIRPWLFINGEPAPWLVPKKKARKNKRKEEQALIASLRKRHQTSSPELIL